MTVVFVTNYYNHHQSAFAGAMDEQTAHKFYFIETEPLDTERKQMGWGEEKIPHYVLQSYRSHAEKKRCRKLIFEADVVIWGSCPMSMVRRRLTAGKLTFAYSERLFKEGFHGIAYWGRLAKYYFKLRPYQKSHYLLCASAYAAEDYARIGLFKNRAYRWGYFPEVKKYDDLETLVAQKTENSLLWAGRLIPWKHPEEVIELARRLKESNFSFQLKIIGCGELEPVLAHMINEHQLEDYVHMMGSMRPEEVRKHMEKSEIFLFTSDQNEGWGAVLNESMNSACSVVVNSQIGSAPYLICDGQNGLHYHNGNADELFENVKALMLQPACRRKLGECAYHTMINTWNAQIAAQRLIQFAENRAVPFADGPMSPTEYDYERM